MKIQHHYNYSLILLAQTVDWFINFFIMLLLLTPTRRKLMTCHFAKRKKKRNSFISNICYKRKSKTTKNEPCNETRTFPMLRFPSVHFQVGLGLRQKLLKQGREKINIYNNSSKKVSRFINGVVI